MHVSETVVTKLRDSSLGHAAIAYLCYKIATPLRYTVTLGGTTLSIKYLSQWGYIRPVPTKARLKQIYDDQKAKFQQKDWEKNEIAWLEDVRIKENNKKKKFSRENKFHLFNIVEQCTWVFVFVCNSNLKFSDAENALVLLILLLKIKNSAVEMSFCYFSTLSFLCVVFWTIISCMVKLNIDNFTTWIQFL